LSCVYLARDAEAAALAARQFASFLSVRGESATIPTMGGPGGNYSSTMVWSDSYPLDLGWWCGVLIQSGERSVGCLGRRLKIVTIGGNTPCQQSDFSFSTGHIIQT